MSGDRDELSPLARDVVYAQRHRLLDDSIGRAYQRVFEHGVADRFVAEQIAARVRKHKTAQAMALTPFPTHHLEPGSLGLGLDERGRPIRCPIQYLNGHGLTIGGSGSGKTTRSRFLALQVAPQVSGCFLFDLRKREFRILKPYLARMGIDLVILGARQMRLNPLELPSADLDPRSWAARVADVLVHAVQLPPRATKLLHLHTLTLFERYERTGVMPCLYDLREAIAHDRQSNVPARQAILDTLDPVLVSLGPGVLAYRRGWNPNDLALRHLVFEFDGVGEAEQTLLLSSLLLSVFTSRLAEGRSNAPMSLWVCVDEAARLVARETASPSILDLMGLVRGMGVGVDFSTQRGDVHPAILSNTACKSVMRCGSATDYDLIGSAMGLTGEQRQWLSVNLHPGVSIAQVGEGAWRHPLLVQIPQMRLSPASSGAESEQPLADLPVEEASEYAGWSPSAETATVSDGAPAVTAVPLRPATAPLSEVEARYLRAMLGQPGQASSVYSYKVQAELVSGEPATAELVVRAVRTLLAGQTFLTEPERREILAAATTRIDVTVRKIDQFSERDPLGRWKGTKRRYALETVEFA